jgi:hypothetical protein
MRILRIITVLLFSFLAACATQSTVQSDDNQVDCESASEPTEVSMEEDLATVPIDDGDLEGIWIRVLRSMPNPDMSGHYWLKLNPDGTFKVTQNKMAFDGDVTHQGKFEFEDSVFTFFAEKGSLRCEGQSASYEATKFEDGSMELVTIEAPCEDWLSMGQGKLGEDTLWVRPNE